MNLIEIALVALAALAGLRQFAYLCFNSDKAIKSLLKNNFGDLPLHITYIKHIANGAAFPPDNPVWGFDKLRYPFGVDFYNALWESLGMQLPGHMFLVGFICTMLAIYFLRWWGGAIAVGAFFFNGGWAGFKIFTDNKFADYQDLYAWKNIVTSIFVTQRGFLIAIPLGVLILKVVHDYCKGSLRLDKGQLVLLGFLWGIMAFFHLHTFIIISLIIAGYIIIFKKYSTKDIFALFAIAVPIASIFILYSTNFLRGASIIHIKPGWMFDEYHQENGGGSIFSFWFDNAGPWAIAILSFFIFEMISGRSRNRPEWILMLGLFVTFNFIMLAPWDWDNMKVLIWPYLGLAQLIAVSISAAKSAKWHRPWIYYPGLALVSFVLFFTGIVSVISVIYKDAPSYEIYKWEEINYTKGATKGISPDALFAGEPTWNNPLGYCGHKLVIGYPGHLWSHNIKSADMENKQDLLFRSNSDWRTLTRELNIDYIFWGPREKKKYGNFTPSWAGNLKNVSTVPGYEVYKVK